MAFATTSSAANRKPGANAQTAAPPQAQARPRPRRSSGKAWRPNAPGRKPGSGALAEPNSEFPRRRIVNLVQPWSKQAILRSLKAKTRDSSRYRKAHTRTNDKNVHLSLPRPRKTVGFDRQRPKQTVFRIAPPGRRRRGARARVMPSGRRRGAGARRPHANDTAPSTVSPAC